LIPLGPKKNPTAINPVMLGSQGMRCVMNPPRDPISRMRPNAINGVKSVGKLGK